MSVSEEQRGAFAAAKRGKDVGGARCRCIPGGPDGRDGPALVTTIGRRKKCRALARADFNVQQRFEEERQLFVVGGTTRTLQTGKAEATAPGAKCCAHSMVDLAGPSSGVLFKIDFQKFEIYLVNKRVSDEG